MNKLLLLPCSAVLLSACATDPNAATRVNNSAGRASVYEDVRTSSSIQGIGVESQDIVGIADKMVRDMLSNPILAGRATPPRVLIDSEYFKNMSSSRVDKDLIINKLRVQLSRAANGRMIFVGRQYAGVAEAEADLQRAGVVDGGTTGAPTPTLRVDYRLVGSMNSQDAVGSRSGETLRYQTFTFEMLDVRTLELVWSNEYEYKKSAQDDLIYR